VCPDEVLYNDQIYVVECTDHIVGFQQVRLSIPAELRDQQLRVRYHSGDAETERHAWTVQGVDPTELIVLDEGTRPSVAAVRRSRSRMAGLSPHRRPQPRFNV
jgi:hypothetical protein